jgi:hypothetical protein
MNGFCLAVLFSLSLLQATAQTKQDVQLSSEGPLPQLNGTWKLTEYKTPGRSYYADSLKHYINSAFKEAKARSTKPLSGEDSTKLYTRYKQLFSNILNSQYVFRARTFFIDNNGDKQMGSLSFNSDKTVLTLFIDEKSDKSKTLKIDFLDGKKLVLIPVDYSAGMSGKELGRMVFIREAEKK